MLSRHDAYSPAKRTVTALVLRMPPPGEGCKAPRWARRRTRRGSADVSPDVPRQPQNLRMLDIKLVAPDA